MKVNLVGLMSEISLRMKEYHLLEWQLESNNTKETAIELNKTETIMKDNEHFMEDYDKMLNLSKKIAYYKGIIAQKNATSILKNNKNIAENLIYLSYLRKNLEIINRLLIIEESTKRVTETNNSYFVNTKPAFSMITMKEEKDRMENEIKEIELEISQINSEMFEIEDI